MTKFNTSEVPQEHIDKIQNMLNSDDVGPLWFAHTGAKDFKDREDTFNSYAKARDKFLKLKPLVVEGIQGTNQRSVRR